MNYADRVLKWVENDLNLTNFERQRLIQAMANPCVMEAARKRVGGAILDKVGRNRERFEAEREHAEV